jgi:hypothetical protein
MALVAFLRASIPGFANCHLIVTPAQVGVRETRRIVGEYVLTQEDIVCGRQFADNIALSAYPIDIHNPLDGGNVTVDILRAHGIPYRCLLPKGASNLIAAGRIISVTHEAFAAIRVTPPVFAIGQAAGTAAALAIEKGVLPAAVPIHELQERLTQQKAVLHSGRTTSGGDTGTT